MYTVVAVPGVRVIIPPVLPPNVCDTPKSTMVTVCGPPGGDGMSGVGVGVGVGVMSGVVRITGVDVGVKIGIIGLTISGVVVGVNIGNIDGLGSNVAVGIGEGVEKKNGFVPGGPYVAPDLNKSSVASTASATHPMMRAAINPIFEWGSCGVFMCISIHDIVIHMEPKHFLSAVLLAGAVYIAGQYVANDAERHADNVLTVQATGKGEATPTLAHIMLGVHIQPQQTSAAATDMLAKQANAIIDALTGMGIEKADMKTQNVSIQPAYNYDNGKQTLRGYEASQQLDVTVRNTEQAGDIVARATENGANQIGGLTFSTDNPEVIQLSAEQNAIANARTKAEQLAKALGVRLGKVRSYTAQQQYGGPMPYALEAKGIGGDAVTAPQLPPGTQESTVTVTVTYELR